MTTEVQKTEQSMMPAGTGGAYDPSDYSIPFLSLVQASSDAVKQRKAQAGDFLASDGEQYESLTIVPLHIQFTRDFYNADKAESICGSPDRVTGYPRDLAFFKNEGLVELEKGRPLACRECPFEAMEYGKLACKKGYTVTCYDVDRDQPFMFRVRGTAVNAFKHSFVGAVAMGRTVPWARQYTLSSELKASGGNSWFVPVLTPVKGHDAEEAKFWGDMASQYGQTHNAEHVDMGMDDEPLPFD